MSNWAFCQCNSYHSSGCKKIQILSFRGLWNDSIKHVFFFYEIFDKVNHRVAQFLILPDTFEFLLSVVELKRTQGTDKLVVACHPPGALRRWTLINDLFLLYLNSPPGSLGSSRWCFDTNEKKLHKSGDALQDSQSRRTREDRRKTNNSYEEKNKQQNISNQQNHFMIKSNA